MYIQVQNVNLTFRKRKIVQVNKTFYVSLPKIWLENMKLGKGDFLNMELVDGNIVLGLCDIHDK